MNLNKILAVGAAILSMAGIAKAQIGNDVFYPTRSYPLLPNANNLPLDINPNGQTNGIVDALNLTGRAVIDVCVLTNTEGAGAAGTITLLPITSQDGTNWTSVTNFAFVTPQSYTVTNSLYGSPGYLFVATNTVVPPGVLTTPTAYSALYASIPYFPASKFTNQAAVTVKAVGWYKIAFNVDDQVGRYIALQTVPSNLTGTNFLIGAEFTGTAASGGAY